MRASITVFLLLMIFGCGNLREVTGEINLYNSGKLNVKVVQIYENMPWHYYGLKHEVWCQSPSTANMHLVEVDRGWNLLGTSAVSEPGQSPSDAVKHKVLESSALEERNGVMIVNDETLLRAKSGLVTVTFDGCKSLFTMERLEYS